MPSITAKLSTSARSIALDVNETQLTAGDLSQLIAVLANLRRQMSPPVDSENSPLQQGGRLEPGTIDPRWDCALLEQDPKPVVLAIALDGLGWHTIQMAATDAERLGRQLLALSPTAPH